MKLGQDSSKAFHSIGCRSRNRSINLILTDSGLKSMFHHLEGIQTKVLRQRILHLRTLILVHLSLNPNTINKCQVAEGTHGSQIILGHGTATRLPEIISIKVVILTDVAPFNLSTDHHPVTVKITVDKEGEGKRQWIGEVS